MLVACVSSSFIAKTKKTKRASLSAARPAARASRPCRSIKGSNGALHDRITRRDLLVAGAALTLDSANPARALLATAVPEGAPPAFIEALIARMTLEEKAGQLTLMAAAWGGAAANAVNPPKAGTDFEQQLAEAGAGHLTGVFNGNGAVMAQRMQRAAMDSRLKIPLLFAADIIHGHRTVFPVPLAEAASFEPELAARTARVAAVEAAAAGIDWTFAPMVDVAHDARWGRCVEGAGEDVLLGRLFAAARVRGFQGRDAKADDALIACAKHFAAYGAGEGGLDYNGADVSEATLHAVYFPPFQAAFAAGAATVMAAFNDLSGVPATANRWLLTQVLREQWRFDGPVVSDYEADQELVAHGYAIDDRDAARLAILAGTDISMQSGLYLRYLPGLVAAGQVPMARLDQAVRRVLTLKAEVGLFDDPFRRIDPRREQARSRTPDHLALAREAARKSIVLLRNEGAILPLANNGQRIALIGPFAAGAHDLIGPWNVYGDDAEAIDLATGMRASMRAPAALTVVAGCAPEQAIAGGIEAAVIAAHGADIVVLAIGEHAGMSGEAQSRTAVTIPAPQQALAEAVAAVGKPVIVVLKHGRALALEGAVLRVPAILATWFLGSETGTAIADILFGDHGPSGRLPVSFPQESGQEPFYYAHKSTGRPDASDAPPVEYKTHYRTATNQPRFAFGHGLTYGRIGYSRLEGDGAVMPEDGSVELAVTITNSGTRAAEEVVQLYLHIRTASVTQPVRELKAFQKVRLERGTSARIAFTVRSVDLVFLGPDLRPTRAKGAVDFWIAPSATSGLAGSFTVKAAVPLR